VSALALAANYLILKGIEAVDKRMAK